MALENARRRAAGRSNLIPDASIRAVAAQYARFLVESGWWSTASNPHVAPNGRTAFDRLDGGGVSRVYASENLAFGVRPLTPCDFYGALTGAHIRNFMGESALDQGVVYEPLYSGIACYIDSIGRFLLCDQYFVAR
ncbi:MAG: hypothetical protein WBD55_12440 [Dehalococcoidia bacterium]